MIASAIALVCWQLAASLAALELELNSSCMLCQKKESLHWPALFGVFHVLFFSSGESSLFMCFSGRHCFGVSMR